MTLIDLRAFLGWGAVINYALLLFWFAFFTQGHDFLYRLHGRWFSLGPERFDAIHQSISIFFRCHVTFTFNATWM